MAQLAQQGIIPPLPASMLMYAVAHMGTGEQQGHTDRAKQHKQIKQ